MLAKDEIQIEIFRALHIGRTYWTPFMCSVLYINDFPSFVCEAEYIDVGTEQNWVDSGLLMEWIDLFVVIQLNMLRFQNKFIDLSNERLKKKTSAIKKFTIWNFVFN